MQSGQVWNIRLHKKLLKLGMIQLPSEPCIYVLPDSRGKPKLIYVDDIVLTGPDKVLMTCVEEDFA